MAGAISRYTGDGHADNRDAADSPFNVYNLALRIHKRRLFSGQVRVLVTSRSPSVRRAAWELGLAGDDVIREINLDAMFDKVLRLALLSIRYTGLHELADLPKAGGISITGEPPCRRGFASDRGQRPRQLSPPPPVGR